MVFLRGRKIIIIKEPNKNKIDFGISFVSNIRKITVQGTWNSNLSGSFYRCDTTLLLDIEVMEV